MDIRRAMASAPRKHETGAPRPLLTPWGETVHPLAVRQEHPHPQFAREGYQMLNGWWDYAIVPMASRSKVRLPDQFDGHILVPFSPEAILSGVLRTLEPDELIWYVRRIEAPSLREKDRCLLHFEAVDFACACCVNGKMVGTHRGGYLPFTYDITEQVERAWKVAEETGEPAELVIALCAWDPSDRGTQPRGKQKLESGGIWYTAQSGIWQPVWMEVVPDRHIEALRLLPDADARTLTIEVDVHGTQGVVRGYLTDGDGRAVASVEASAEEGAVPLGEEADRGDHAADARKNSRRVRLTMTLPSVHRWSPESPYLYHLTLRYGTDVVRSYTAFRTVSVEVDESGCARFCLNGEPYLVRGVLDQGYWSDGLMTAPADEAFVYDIASMKEAGFNMLRKHLKVEADRWYYHCDRLGMLVWQDMVSGGGEYHAWETSFKPTLWRHSWGSYDDTVASHQEKLGSADGRYQAQWRRACRSTVAYLANHPCVASWVLFNEGWGQFDAAGAAEIVHRMDPTRPVDAVSGWYDQHCGDFLSVHNYFRKLKVYRDKPRLLQGYRREKGPRAFVISEFGGLTFRVDEHSAFAESYGYDTFDDPEAWRRAVWSQLEDAASLQDAGLSGYVYTQLSDVEEEVNGLLTYDRRVNKLKEDYHGPYDRHG